MSVFAVTGEFNGLAVAIFAVVLAVTLLITRWAASRTKTTTEFYTAGRGISGRKNGLAIAGEASSRSPTSSPTASRRSRRASPRRRRRCS